MSLYGFREAINLHTQDVGFYALIMAAMLKADSVNIFILQQAFPETHRELQARYDAPGGWLPGERPGEARCTCRFDNTRSLDPNADPERIDDTDCPEHGRREP